MKSAIRDRIDTARTDAPHNGPANNKPPGPKTPEAKAVVRWNSYRHGLTGQLLRISAEEQPHFDRIAEGFFQRFQPADGFEEQLVQHLIDDNWRLNSCAALENALFAQGDMSHRNPSSHLDDDLQHLVTRALIWQQQSGSFEHLGRYETQIHRRFYRNLKALQDAQIARRPAGKAAPKSTQPIETTAIKDKIDLFRKMLAPSDFEPVDLTPSTGDFMTASAPPPEPTPKENPS